MVTLLNPGGTDAWGQAEKLAFVLERKAIFQFLNLFTYVFFGILLVVLIVALHERIKPKAGVLMLRRNGSQPLLKADGSASRVSG